MILERSIHSVEIEGRQVEYRETPNFRKGKKQRPQCDINRLNKIYAINQINPKHARKLWNIHKKLCKNSANWQSENHCSVDEMIAMIS